MISKEKIKRMKESYSDIKSCRKAARYMGYSEYEISKAFPYKK